MGIEIEWHGKGIYEKGYQKGTDRVLVEVDSTYLRPTEVEFLQGDPTKAKEKLKWEIDLLEENEEELLENKEYYEELRVKKESYKKEIQSINLAIKTIKDLSIDIHDSFGRKLNTIVSKLIKNITKGKYQKLNVNEKLKIKTEIDDKYQHLERLSTGTIDQFYLSLRLAIADLIYKKGKVPILLDDSFVNYDDQRLRSTLEMLLRERNRQVLLFTCQKREKEILDELRFAYEYIEI